MKQKKLLYKTQKIYILYAIIASVSVFPLFYHVTNQLYIQNTDEYLYYKKEKFVKHVLPKLKIKDIDSWNANNLDAQILQPLPLKKDSFFSDKLLNETEQEYEPYRIIYSPVKIEQQEYLFTDKINLLEADDLIENIAILFLGLIFILLLGMIIITRLISKKLWTPFYNLLNELEKFELGKNVLPGFIQSSTKEFQRLNTSIENLIRRNIAVYESQKEFVENAAHELQTPVAVIKAKLDALFQNADITKEQAEILNDISNTISRLNRLNKNLLLLSKIDKQQYEHTQEFLLNDIVKSQIELLTEQARTKNIEISSDFQKEIYLNTNKDLVEILTANLLSNAIKHNHFNGKINITLSDNCMTIENTGKNTSLPADRLFKRFSKINISDEGTGLGLSIIKKIADLNQWQMAYKFENNYHIFTLLFNKQVNFI